MARHGARRDFAGRKGRDVTGRGGAGQGEAGRGEAGRGRGEAELRAAGRGRCREVPPLTSCGILEVKALSALTEKQCSFKMRCVKKFTFTRMRTE